MNRIERCWIYVLSAGLVGALSACGGGPGDPDPLPPTPDPCAQTMVEQDAGPVDPRNLVYWDFSIPQSGRLDTTLDWTYAPTRMGFYLVPANTCSLQEFNNRSCNFLVRSEPPGVKPRKTSTPNFTAGNYRWIIGNFDDTVAEAYSLQIFISTATCPAHMGTPPSSMTASDRDDSLPDMRGMTASR